MGEITFSFLSLYCLLSIRILVFLYDFLLGSKSYKKIIFVWEGFFYLFSCVILIYVLTLNKEWWIDLVRFLRYNLLFGFFVFVFSFFLYFFSLWGYIMFWENDLFATISAGFTEATTLVLISTGWFSLINFIGYQ